MKTSTQVLREAMDAWFGANLTSDEVNDFIAFLKDRLRDDSIKQLKADMARYERKPATPEVEIVIALNRIANALEALKKFAAL